MSELHRTAAGAVLLVCASCAPLAAPGMVAASSSSASEVSRAPEVADSTLHVAFPASACTSAESAVFLDEEGRFLGAVAPGTAAALTVQPASTHVFMVGSMDVVAPPKTWFVRHEIPRRGDQGVVVKVAQADGHNCMGKWSAPLFPRAEAESLANTAEAARGLRQLQVNAAEGRRWLDEHRERVDELLGRGPVEVRAPQPVVTETIQPY